MAYINKKNKVVNTTISISSPDVKRTCNIRKQYSSNFTINKELDTTDAFINLVSLDDAVGGLNIGASKAILITNVGLVGIELYFSVQAWKNNSGTDSSNSDDLGLSGARITRYWTWLLPAGEAFHLPNSRVVAYEEATGGTFESGAFATDGAIEVEPADINSGEIIAASGASLKASGAGADDLDNPGIFLTDATETSFLKVGDAINIGTEVMVITGITHAAHRFTVDRGMFGSDIASHADGDTIAHWFGNQYLVFAAGAQKCKTDHFGRFKQTGAFFSKSRTADRIADGIVPGSAAIGPFYSIGGHLDFGIVGLTPSDRHGLTGGTSYGFTFVVDDFHTSGLGSITNKQDITFTPDSSDLTFNTGKNSLIPKIQTAIDEKVRDPSSPLYQLRVTIGIINGDLRISSNSHHEDTRIGINTTTAGTTPFSVGRFPTVSSHVINVKGEQISSSTNTIMFGPKSRLEDETILDPATGLEVQNVEAFILDDGNGSLVSGSSGEKVGVIDYERGFVEFTGLPSATFKVWGRSHSAHSGGTGIDVVGGYNGLQTIKARCVNRAVNGKIEIDVLA